MFWLKYTISRIKCLLDKLIAEWTLQNIGKGSVKACLQIIQTKREQDKVLRKEIMDRHQ